MFCRFKKSFENVGVNETRAGILDIVQRMGGEVDVFNEKEDNVQDNE